jgi:hypothetical protein
MDYSSLGIIKIFMRLLCVSEYVGSNKAGDSMPGLFAAGNDIGGWESYTYCVFLSGSTLGFAINSGRIVWENALGYIKSIRK